MIIFLNFAPFEFGGGAERWSLDVSSSIKKAEETFLVDTKRSISNWYGKLFLKQSYSQKIKINEKNHISLGFLSLVPFTTQWKKARKVFTDARIIYMRYELLEALIVLYFGGFSSLGKTIAGTHSPLIYGRPAGVIDRAHNYIYNSIINPVFMKLVKKVHVMNIVDKKYLANKFNAKNIVHIPNYIKMSQKNGLFVSGNNQKILNITFVGALNKRKGTDILLKTILSSPGHFIFHIAGDGPYSNEVKKMTKFKNVKYYGYTTHEKLENLYAECDVLFQPSRAESFSLVCLEAMSNGLPVISSAQTNLSLPSYVQKINKTGKIEEYLKIFNDFYECKMNGNLQTQKAKVHEYISRTHSEKVILPRLHKELFNII